MRHYFTDNEDLPSNCREHVFTFQGATYHFFTDNGVFSKNGVDTGTQVLLKILCGEELTGRVLDIGCGYGVIGIVIKKQFPHCEVLLSDVNKRAVTLSKKNVTENEIQAGVIESNGFEKIDGQFDVILSNPPIRAGKQVVFSFYEEACQRLLTNGRFYCVIRTKQGAKSSESKLQEIFGNCDTLGISKGYRVYRCMKHQ